MGLACYSESELTEEEWGEGGGGGEGFGSVLQDGEGGGMFCTGFLLRLFGSLRFFRLYMRGCSVVGFVEELERSGCRSFVRVFGVLGALEMLGVYLLFLLREVARLKVAGHGW